MASKARRSTEIEPQRREEVVSDRAILVAYLHVKADAEDWHAVARAATDLCELDVKISLLS